MKIAKACKDGAGITDFRPIMFDIVDDLALSNMNWTPNKACKELKVILDSKAKAWNGHAAQQIIKRVKNARAELCGNDVFRTIEQDHVGKVKGTNNWFLQFNATVIDPESRKLERLIGFGNPELILLLNGKVKAHFDATFYIVPEPFQQCLIIMVCDAQTQMFVPCLCILMTCECKD